MITQLVTSYTFTKTAKTIQSADFLAVERIMTIIHQPSGQVIYQINNPAKGGTLAGTTLTLDFDTNTVAFNNSDPLFILYFPDLINDDGRVKVAAQPARQNVVAGGVTGLNGQVAIDVSVVSNLAIQLVSGTFAGHNISFEASTNSTNGTDGQWVAIQVARTNANTAEIATGALSAVPAYGWEVNVNGYTWFRVRATAATSGTSNWRLSPAPFSTEPVPVIQTHAVTGSGNFTVVPGTGTFTVGGVVATDAAVSGNPVYMGSRASDARPARMSADNDMVPLWSDRHGAQVMEIGGPRGLKGRQRTTITSSTAETTIVTAGGAGIFRDVYRILVHNTSAVTTVVSIRDATAGTVVFPPITLAAGEKWGFSAPSSDGELQAVANNNWTAQCSVSVASVEITTSFINRL